MKIKDQNLKDLITIMFITFTLFIANEKTDSLFSALYIILLGFMYLFCNKDRKNDRQLYILISVVGLALLGNLLFGKFGIIDALKKFTFLILTFIEYNLLKTKYTSKQKLETKYFIKCFLKIISIWLFVFIPYNLILGNSGFNFVYPINVDKNYTAISIFLFLCLCFKEKYNFGIVVSIVFGLMLKSRLFILGVLCLLAIKYIIKYSNKIPFLKKIVNYFESFTAKQIFILIVIFTAVMLALSYSMVYFIPTTSIKGHNQSLNDDSNAMRVRANVYAVEVMIKNPRLILYGYDSNIKKELGVEIPSKSTIYRGFRLVQPHNFLLNLILRYGLILSIIYLLIISKLLSCYWNRDNLPIILTYLMMNMIMHSLLSSVLLVFFFFVLKINEMKDTNVKKSLNDLYVCYTLYHLLITLIKAIKSGSKPDIILAADHYNNTLTTDKTIIKKLQNCKYINNIIIHDYSKQQIAILSEKFVYIKKYFFVINKVIENSIPFEKYKNIYMFKDSILIGRILNYKNIPYHLIEDGTDCFIYNHDLMKKSFKSLFKKYILNINGDGESKNIIDIEVNNKNGLFIKNKKIIEVPKKELFMNINLKDQKILKNIFMENVDLDKINNKAMIITQPLFEDGILKTEEEKINLYQSIIQKYCKNEKTILKTHPREKTNYSKLKDVLVINDNFPLEILNLYSNIHLKKIITISSTSIQLINNCDKKIFLGWEYLNNFKKVYDEKK